MPGIISSIKTAIIDIFRNQPDEDGHGTPAFHLLRDINLIALSTCGLIIVGTPVCYHLIGDPVIIRDGIIGAFLMLDVLLLNYLRLREMANVFFYLAMNLITYRLTAYHEGVAGMELVYVFLIILIFLVFENRLTRLICVLILVASVTAFELTFKDPFSTVVTLCILALILLVLLVNIMRQIREERRAAEESMFFTHMSHDVNVAFSAVAGIGAHLQSAMDNAEPVNDLVDAIDFTGYILKTFVEYTRVSAGRRGRYEQFDLHAEIEEIIDRYRYIARIYGVSIHLASDDEKPLLLYSDRFKVGRIFINLLSNAMKHTKEGGRIQVKIGMDNKCWRLSVVNEGECITSEKLQMILLAFNTHKKESNQRLGLGLWITRQLAKSLGGDIKVPVYPGAEACFHVQVPMG